MCIANSQRRSAACPFDMEQQLDVITIGRASVDLYGGQVGGRLEDMGSFSKYIGGSPTNIAAGAARLGLKSALITRVGDESMGRFIREELERTGVDVRGVRTDPSRLTALVLLGIRNEQDFPLIFYRENCADMALCENDIDRDFILQSRSVCATGTHLSHPDTEAAVIKALDIARDNGRLTALDIDFRPNLWGLSGHGDGASRFIASDRVTASLQSVLGMFDLVVGTEEEFHIAGGSTCTISALRTVRELTSATLICKRGPMGASAFTGDIPDSLDNGETGRGFDVEVFNVLGAGDGFMAGLLKGWLTGEDWPRSLEYANACGALAVSRHGCAPSYPSWEELRFFLERGVRIPALRKDPELSQIHWSTNRGRNWPVLHILDLEDRLPAGLEAGRRSRAGFRKICLDAVRRVANRRDGFGVVCGTEGDRTALMDATGTGLWIGRPVDSGRPGRDLGSMDEWPLEQIVVTSCPAAAAADPGDRTRADALGAVFHAARRRRLELMIMLTEADGGPASGPDIPAAIRNIYHLGIHPDWWMLGPPQPGRAWEETCREIGAHDHHVRGIMIRNTRSTDQGHNGAFNPDDAGDLISGIAAGSELYGDTARLWFDGSIGDGDAARQVADRFDALCRDFNRNLARRNLPH